MQYFNTRQVFFLCSYTIDEKEQEKIDKFLKLLDDSGVAEVLNNTTAEYMLTFLGYNIRKLFRYYSGNLKADYWKAPDDLKPETFKKPSAVKLSKKASERNKKSVNQKAKSGYRYKKRTV